VYTPAQVGFATLKKVSTVMNGLENGKAVAAAAVLVAVVVMMVVAVVVVVVRLRDV
jgi:hypothetical protein